MGTPNTNDNVVFIDTNLDTHLAVTVSDQDTVSDLKKSILSEHSLCFPKIGDIQIHGIKVKRKGCFYYLSDSMFVRSVFSGSNKGWFLSVDASVLGECARNEHLLCNGSPNPVACLGIVNNALIGHGDNAIRLPSRRVPSFDDFKLPRLENKLVENEEISGASPLVSEHSDKGAVKTLDAGVKSSGGSDTGIPLRESITETEDRCFVNQELLLSSNIECGVDGSDKGIEDGHNVSEESPLISGAIAKKKRRRKGKKEEMVQGDDSEDATASVGRVTNKLPDSHIECEVDGVVSEEENCKSVSNVKKKKKSKRKKEDSVGEDRVLDDTSTVNEISAVVKKKRKSKREKEDTVPDYTSKVNGDSVVGTSDYAIQQAIEVVANPSENADKEVIMETEVLKEHQLTDCNNNNAKNDLGAAMLVNEVLEPGPVANKKHKKRKRSLPDDSKELFNVETASQKNDVQKFDEVPKERIESKDQFAHENKKPGDDVKDKHDKVTEDILDTEPPAKKKKRSKEKNREKSLSRVELINGFNVDNVSHHILEDQQKIKNSNADQSAEHFSETDPPTSSVQGRRRKGKINSLNPPETSVVTSSRKDEEADRSIIQRGFKEEISEDGLFSKVVDNTDSNIGELNVTSKVVDVNGMTEPIKSEKKKRGTRKATNSAGGSSLTEGTGLVDASKSETAIMKSRTATKCDPVSGNRETEKNPLNQTEGEKMQQEKILGSSDKEDVFNADYAGSLEQIETKSNGEHMDKGTNSAGGSALTEGNGLVDASKSETAIMKSHAATKCDPMSGHRETEKNPLNQTEGEKMQQEKILGISDKEDVFNADIAGSAEQIKTKSNAEHMDKGQRKESNNKQTSNSKSTSSVLPKEQESAGKASRNNVHGVVSKTQQKKNLLAGAIFKDDSSSTSEDKVDDSDASTTTPPDNLLLSDFSDEDNSSCQNSQVDGSYDGKSPGNGGISSLKESFSGTKKMRIVEILRSSRRFQKVRTKASQLEESESQQEFVPDSLAE